MCAQHEHRFRVEIKIKIEGHGWKDHSVILYAKGVTEAIGKADGWAQKNFPGASVIFEIWRMGYSSDEVATEHGAILKETPSGSARK